MLFWKTFWNYERNTACAQKGADRLRFQFDNQKYSSELAVRSLNFDQIYVDDSVRILPISGRHRQNCASSSLSVWPICNSSHSYPFYHKSNNTGLLYYGSDFMVLIIFLCFVYFFHFTAVFCAAIWRNKEWRWLLDSSLAVGVAHDHT